MFQMLPAMSTTPISSYFTLGELASKMTHHSEKKRVIIEKVTWCPPDVTV